MLWDCLYWIMLCMRWPSLLTFWPTRKRLRTLELYNKQLINNAYQLVLFILGRYSISNWQCARQHQQFKLLRFSPSLKSTLHYKWEVHPDFFMKLCIPNKCSKQNFLIFILVLSFKNIWTFWTILSHVFFEIFGKYMINIWLGMCRE